MSKKVKENKEFYIVGIGASAGGLEALEGFLSSCPNDTGIAFVIVQHLSPDYKSMMSSLLARHTKMPIKVADDTDTIKANHIYLIPGNKNLIVKNGKLELIDRAQANQLNLPIDLFFESLAIEKKDKAIGIILSGTGSDGTRGGKAIKAAGGTIFVQDPETIRFDGMPLTAIENGIADYVLIASEIPIELLNFIHFPTARSDWEMQSFIDDEEGIDEILKIIRRNTGYNFLSYRRQTLIRRITKRLKINKLKSLEEYKELIESDVSEQRTAVDEFLINVTKFFRDSAAYRVLEKVVIPKIVQEAYKKKQDIKAWSVGCSTGEEAYSLAILIEEAMEKLQMEVSYKVFATDVDSQAIEKGSKGEYKIDVVNDITPKLLNKYFIHKNNAYQIKSSIRKNIIFSKHDILQNPPFNKMDLITCRNMLIYFNADAQKKAIASMHFALKLNGHIFLGSSESLGAISRCFEVVDRKSKIYKNIDSSNRVFRDKNDMAIYSFSPHIPSKGRTLKEKFGYYIGEDLVSAVNAICIFVDEKFDILHAKGSLSKYFSLPEEGYSNNIMSVLPATLNIPISTAIRHLGRGKEEGKVITKELQFLKDKERLKLQLRVRELPSSVQTTSFLITILEIGKTKLRFDKSNNSITSVEEVQKYQNEIRELRQALVDAKENLQLTVEELETTNEEIQATNEELIASNEELQSTNEELQSVNEELHTVNAELQEKNVELLSLNADMENLINSTDIGTIFLDRDFKIRRFTPAIAHQIRLKESDIGRSVSDFFWHNLNLEEESKEVLQSLQPIRSEFQNKAGDWYLKQIQPYRTNDNIIGGIVINFINIDSLKKAIQEKEKANHFLEQVTDLSPGVIYVYDLEKKRFAYFSKSLEAVLGYRVEEIMSMSNKDFDLLLSPASKEKVISHIQNMKSALDKDMNFIEFKLKNNRGKEIWLASIEKIFERNKKGEVTKIIGFALDNTEQMKMIERENENLHFISEVTMLSPDIVYVYDAINEKTIYANRKLLQTLKTTTSKKGNYLRSHPFMKAIHPNDLEAYKIHLKTLKVSRKDSLYIEIRIKNKGNNYRWVSITEKAFERNSDGKVSKIIGTIKDIHAFRQVQMEKEQLNKLQLALKESNEKLERFAYISSHDLKEPLNTIISALDLMKLEIQIPSAAQIIQPIEDSTKRMKNLIEDLLNYSLLGKKPLSLQSVSLEDLLVEVQQDMSATLNQHDAKLTLKSLPKIIADKTLIKQVFQNLISNGIRYNDKARPSIIIDAEEKTNEFIISVKDNGIGIDEKDFNTIFDVFKRLHHRESYFGTGIGLANCKSIVQAHKGKIWVESIVNEGSTFYFSIQKKQEPNLS